MPSNRRDDTRRTRAEPRRGLRWGRLAILVTSFIFGPVFIVATAWGLYGQATAPASIFLRSTPADATIVLTGGPKKITLKGSGKLSLQKTPPGTYTATFTHPGYKPVTETYVVGTGGGSNSSVSLEALPVALRLDIKPSSATWRLTRSNDVQSRTGTGSWSGSALPGGYTLVLSAKGSASKTTTFTLGSTRTVTAWLDPSGQIAQKLAVFKCVPAPKGVSITPDGKQVWVTALVTQPSIAAYDPVSGRLLGSADLGKNGAVEVTFNKDGTRAYASQMQSASVYEIDTKTFKVLRTFRTGSSWTKVVEFSPDETKLYAANWSGDDISEIDVKTGKLLRRFPTVDTPRGLYPTPDGRRLFVAGFGEQSLVGRIAVIDLTTGKSTTIFSQKGGAMRHMVADPARGVVYTSDMGKAVIWTTDMKTLKTARFAKTDSHPNTIALSPDKKVLFVSCRGANNPKSYYQTGPEWGSVLLLDASTGRPLDAIVGGNQCTALALSRDGKLLVFSDFMDNRLRSYAIPPFEVLAAGNGGIA
jgi:DNA-binding beta-propeller fold protein YncE